jgi:hypothetical protein
MIRTLAVEQHTPRTGSLGIERREMGFVQDGRAREEKKGKR